MSDNILAPCSPRKYLSSMHITEWFRQQPNMTQRDAAKALGIDEFSFSRYLRGVVTPSLKMAERIATATKGQVPMDSWTKPPPSQQAAQNVLAAR